MTPVGVKQSLHSERFKDIMNKTEFITLLKGLNSELREAIANGDFGGVRQIDEQRQQLLHRLAIEETPENDDELFECLERFSSEIAENIKQVERQFAGFSRRASSKFKVLDGYQI